MTGDDILPDQELHEEVLHGQEWQEMEYSDLELYEESRSMYITWMEMTGHGLLPDQELSEVESRWGLLQATLGQGFFASSPLKVFFFS